MCLMKGQGRSRVCLITGHVGRYGVFKARDTLGV